MFDFRRITLFCLEKHLSKHKMTIFSKNLGGHGLFDPPWLRLWLVYNHLALETVCCNECTRKLLSPFSSQALLCSLLLFTLFVIRKLKVLHNINKSHVFCCHVSKHLPVCTAAPSFEPFFFSYFLQTSCSYKPRWDATTSNELLSMKGPEYQRHNSKQLPKNNFICSSRDVPSYTVTSS